MTHFNDITFNDAIRILNTFTNSKTLMFSRTQAYKNFYGKKGDSEVLSNFSKKLEDKIKEKYPSFKIEKIGDGHGTKYIVSQVIKPITYSNEWEKYYKHFIKSPEYEDILKFGKTSISLEKCSKKLTDIIRIVIKPFTETKKNQCSVIGCKNTNTEMAHDHFRYKDKNGNIKYGCGLNSLIIEYAKNINSTCYDILSDSDKTEKCISYFYEKHANNEYSLTELCKIPHHDEFDDKTGKYKDKFISDFLSEKNLLSNSESLVQKTENLISNSAVIKTKEELDKEIEEELIKLGKEYKNKEILKRKKELGFI